jgi:quinol monooxygenase YgiN
LTAARKLKYSWILRRFPFLILRSLSVRSSKHLVSFENKFVYDNHMLLIVGTFAIPPDNLPAVRPVMNQMVRSSRPEDGCEEYVYAEDLFEPRLIHVKELWRDQSALDLHFASGHLAEWRSSWVRFGIGSRNLRVYEVDAPRTT